ncbi:serine/threonine protein kinase [Capronia epimyces CBS 606.96]|uniref:Serine/threonine protein kinase n=1 Tax=Capronia epimyces CBS 606.96 TaxID=1182542 RepID=W9YJB5_9EURO|nr:serine/threonine protein kinase [Capronia epimyces CBS 606.96]EXJ82339.1 serine/threonine protein kinase [Capronia epimyces CBS 606.96]
MFAQPPPPIADISTSISFCRYLNVHIPVERFPHVIPRARGDSGNSEMCSSVHSSPPSEAGICVVPPRGRYLASGFTAFIYQDGDIILKCPKNLPDSDPESNQLFQDLVNNERAIYERLGPHAGILTYYGVDEPTGATKLEYANDGDLSDYIKSQPPPSEARRVEMIRFLATTWLHIYTSHVSIQDIKTDNILVRDGVPKVADFTDSVVFEDECPRDDLRSDLLGIGCVIYSIATWDVFGFDWGEGNRWPGPDQFRPVDNVLFGDVIAKCWTGDYDSMNGLYGDVVRLAAGFGASTASGIVPPFPAE